MECFSLRRNPHYALFLSSFFTTPQGMHQSLMGSRLIAVYSVCLEILPIVEETRSTRQEPKERMLLYSEGISTGTD